MLGLSDTITACLPDLDGVLTAVKARGADIVVGDLAGLSDAP
jgi:hypothetical protein